MLRTEQRLEAWQPRVIASFNVALANMDVGTIHTRTRDALASIDDNDKLSCFIRFGRQIDRADTDSQWRRRYRRQSADEPDRAGPAPRRDQ